MTTTTPERDRITTQARTIRLSAREAQAFLAALDAPLPPNAALKAALDDYVVRRDDQTGNLDWVPRPKQSFLPATITTLRAEGKMVSAREVMGCMKTNIHLSDADIKRIIEEGHAAAGKA